MITIEKPVQQYSECFCCDSNEGVKQINFQRDGYDNCSISSSVRLCESCRDELLLKLSESTIG